MHKRSYSPTIDDIRQFNIKRQRVLQDFDHLVLLQSAQPTPQELHRPLSTPHTEYIPDIDEFLLLNQDDRDVLESSRHITDWEGLEADRLVIPDLSLVPLTKDQMARRVDALRGKSHRWTMVQWVDQRRLVYQRWMLWVDNEGMMVDDEMMDDEYDGQTQYSRSERMTDAGRTPGGTSMSHPWDEYDGVDGDAMDLD